ncbi:MAG: PD-(D/E)XK nuclease family protein, partial [Burkholderiales bacterium]|nr:PD-(D/E)XK nuclease family protein [Phycisphaerae bacterium]
RIITIHRSKGLEFPVVIIPDLGKGMNLRDGDTRLLTDDSVGIAARVVDAEREIHYATVATVVAKESMRRKGIAEELRVLYVAATRAREHLILVGTQTQEMLDAWDENWTDHRGPIPPGEVLRAGSMLDWLGPVAAAIGGETPGAIQRTFHTIADLEAAGTDILRHGGTTKIDPRVVAMQLIEPTPLLTVAPTDEVTEMIARLEQTYQFTAKTKVPAAASVTARTKSGRTAPRGGPGTQPSVIFNPVLRLPRYISGATTISAADKGNITHTVLQRLDFSRPCDQTDLMQQCDEMANRRFLRREQIASVDFGAITWFLDTPTGRKLRNCTKLLRELDLTFAAPAEADATGDQLRINSTDDPRDSVMVRGRIDAVIVEPDNLAIIDYKTDRIPASGVSDRAEFYTPQIEAYRANLRRMTGITRVDASLVFLSPRIVWDAPIVERS